MSTHFTDLIFEVKKTKQSKEKKNTKKVKQP